MQGGVVKKRETHVSKSKRKKNFLLKKVYVLLLYMKVVQHNVFKVV